MFLLVVLVLVVGFMFDAVIFHFISIFLQLLLGAAGLYLLGGFLFAGLLGCCWCWVPCYFVAGLQVVLLLFGAAPYYCFPAVLLCFYFISVFFFYPTEINLKKKNLKWPIPGKKPNPPPQKKIKTKIQQ